jgi:DNA-binding CsgD family transcriptional regulator
VRPVDDDDLALLRRIADGASAAEVAHELGVSEHALNRRLIRIRRELEAPTTVAAVVTAIRRGLL